MKKKQISVTNLSQFFSNPNNKSFLALDKINIDFPINKITAIIGPSASGKTVLLKHLNGLLIPSKGKVQVNEFTILAKQSKIKYINKIRSQIGFVFEFAEKQLFEETVGKDILFGPNNFDKDLKKSKEIAFKYFDILKLNKKYWDFSPFHLSGGEKRKVVIAGIFAYDPSFILFDQLAGGLDPKVKKNFFKILLNLKKEFDKTIIFTSNNNDDVLEIADHLIVLNEGKVVKQGKPEDILKDSSFCKKLNLIVPKVIQFIEKLKEKNIILEGKKYRTENELIDGLVDFFKKKQEK